MLLAVKVMNQTNQMKTRNRNAFPRSDPNFFTATIYLHERKNATANPQLILITDRTLSHTRSLRSLEPTEFTEEFNRRQRANSFFDFPVRGRKIKTVSHSVTR
jgi:hypothetical protein